MTDSRDKPLKRQNWTLTTNSLQRLLNWLDSGADSDGHSYVEIRRRLRTYFARKKCRTADDLADETLMRVARRLEEEGITLAETPARYCYIVARFVFLEHLHETKSHPIATFSDDVAPQAPDPVTANDEEASGKRLACLKKCLEGLDPLNRRIITRYYIGSERVKIDNRRKLADSLNISSNALAIRASRIRKRLEACVRGCLGAK